MARFRVLQAAELLGVNDATVRRWIQSGLLPVGRDEAGRELVDGAGLARLAQQRAPLDGARPAGRLLGEAGQNRLIGLVTEVIRGSVMAQVEIRAGPFQVMSLLSREAADDLCLVPGVLAVARLTPTSVIVEVPDR